MTGRTRRYVYVVSLCNTVAWIHVCPIRTLSGLVGNPHYDEKDDDCYCI